MVQLDPGERRVWAWMERWSLPLLTKELAEQSTRSRTYVIRTVYAVLLYTVSLWGFYRQTSGMGAFDMLGSGGRLFAQVFWTQLAAIYVILPVLASGVIAAEKERDTLGLLLITKLNARTIVLEKYLSRVVPMLLYLLMSLPLLAVAYSLGGVNSGMVLFAACCLIAAVLQVGAITVACSAWFRTTAQAFVVSYLLLIFSGSFSVLIISTILPARPSIVAQSVMALLVCGIIPAGLALTFASTVLWQRAFLQSRNLLLKALQAVDRWFHELNQNRVTQGVVLFDDTVPLPLDEPITWRETQKRSMGTLRYLIRLLLAIEIPLLFIILLPLADGVYWRSGGYGVLEVMNGIVWWIAVFAVLASSTGLFSQERASQTFDVLMSTPLSTAEIVNQKVAGVRRLIVALWVPIGTVNGFRFWWYATNSDPWAHFDFGAFALLDILPLVIYLPLIGWLGIHVGLRCRTQMAAMGYSVVVIALLTAVPWMMDFLKVLDSGDGHMPILWLVSYDPFRLLLIIAATVLFPPSGPLVNAWDEMLRAAGPEGSGRAVYLASLLAHCLLYSMAWRWLRLRAPDDVARSSGRCEARQAARFAQREEPREWAAKLT